MTALREDVTALREDVTKNMTALREDMTALREDVMQMNGSIVKLNAQVGELHEATVTLPGAQRAAQCGKSITYMLAGRMSHGHASLCTAFPLPEELGGGPSSPDFITAGHCVRKLYDTTIVILDGFTLERAEKPGVRHPCTSLGHFVDEFPSCDVAVIRCSPDRKSVV